MLPVMRGVCWTVYKCSRVVECSMYITFGIHGALGGCVFHILLMAICYDLVRREEMWDASANYARLRCSPAPTIPMQH